MDGSKNFQHSNESELQIQTPAFHTGAIFKFFRPVHFAAGTGYLRHVKDKEAPHFFPFSNDARSMGIKWFVL